MSARHQGIQTSESPELPINQVQLSSHSTVKSTNDKIKPEHGKKLIKSHKHFLININKYLPTLHIQKGRYISKSFRGTTDLGPFSNCHTTE